MCGGYKGASFSSNGAVGYVKSFALSMKVTAVFCLLLVASMALAIDQVS